MQIMNMNRGAFATSRGVTSHCSRRPMALKGPLGLMHRKIGSSKGQSDAADVCMQKTPSRAEGLISQALCALRPTCCKDNFFLQNHPSLQEVSSHHG
eukprot:scaffold89190_cov19-Tisochrysis_lutea.AAC.1